MLRVELTGKQGGRTELLKGLFGEHSGVTLGEERSQNLVSKAERMPFPHGGSVAGTPLSIALRWGDGRVA